jgi:hypothetical protein
MTSLKLDGSGDLALENNSLVLLTDAVEETAQRLKTKFRFFLGEWDMDPRVGFPLWEKVFVKEPHIPTLRALYKEAILEDENVSAITSLSIDYDRSLRKLTMSFEATLKDGSALTFDSFILRENL